MWESGCKGFKIDGKNHQNVMLTECSETGTEKPICSRSVRRQVNVEDLRSKLSYNFTQLCTRRNRRHLVPKW